MAEVREVSGMGITTSMSSQEGQDCLASMAAAANYAWVNRSSMTFLTRQAFAKVFNQSPEDLDMHVIYDVSHNIAKVEEHMVDGQCKQLLVHRKGSTRAFPPHHPLIPVDYQLTGQPVIVGGTMGTCSYVLTGTDTGMRIARTMTEAGRVKPFCAELGGNAPIVVFDDVRSVDEAVDGIAFAAFVASGQTCVSGKRILVQRGLGADFVERLVAKASSLSLGDPMLPTTDLGPLVSAGQLQRVTEQVDRARADGARVLCGGKRPDVIKCALADVGHFYEPTVLASVDPTNTAFAEEIFGPVITVTEFDTEEEAVALANSSQYGLGGAIWTSDVRKAHRVARKLRCGVLWVNCHHRNDPSSPWGGFGQSGIGRENGPEAFEEYTTTQSLTLRTSDVRENWFGDPNARYS